MYVERERNNKIQNTIQSISGSNALELGLSHSDRCEDMNGLVLCIE